MLRLLVSVLAAASFTQAFDPSSLLHDITAAIKHGKDKAVDKVHIPRIIRDKNYFEDKVTKHFGGGEHSCNECTRWVGHHLIAASVNATIEYCKNTDCPIVKKRCEWVHNHKNFTLGYITQRVEPKKSGHLYCAGKGVCPTHDCGNFIDIMNDNNFFMNDNAALEAITDAIDEIDNNNVNADSTIEVESKEIVTPSADELTVVEENDDDFDIDAVLADKDIGKAQLCGVCISSVTSHIIKGTLAQVAAFCKKQTDPKWKARCDFTLAHPGFSSGYLYSKYKPEFTAYGFCYAKKACPHSSSAFMKEVQPAEVFDINF